MTPSARRGFTRPGGGAFAHRAVRGPAIPSLGRPLLRDVSPTATRRRCAGRVPGRRESARHLAGNADRDRRWDHDTVSLSFSTGKGVASTVVHRLAERGLIDYDAPVARYWPEFAAAGKDKITVRELMSHRAGLHRVRGLMPHPLDLMDYDAVVAALAAEKPDPRRLRGPRLSRCDLRLVGSRTCGQGDRSAVHRRRTSGDSEAPRSRRILVPRTRNRTSTDREAVPTYQLPA